MIRKRNEQLAKTVIKGLQSRNMSGYYAEDKEAALKQALELIPEGSTIAMGGCMSAGEIGLISALEAGNYHYIDRSKMDARAGLMAAYDADIFLSSANAITSDGVMVNIDGNSNRVSCIAQGPRKVIFIVGMNKVCADLDSAMKRARNVAAPINAQRFDIKTPCKETGKCFDCKSPDVAAMNWLGELFHKYHYTHVEDLSADFPENFAMSLSLPSAYFQSQKRNSNIGIIPLPHGIKAASPHGSWGLCMSRQTQYPRECCEFIRYVFSLQNQLKISQLTGIPVLKEIYDVMDSFQAGSGNSNILFSQLRNTSFTRPQTPAYPFFSKQFSYAFYNIAMGADAQEEMNHLAQQVDDHLYRHNYYQQS